MAAASSSPEAQKELLLAAGIHKQVGWNWQIDIPLGEFQGVSVDDAGLVVGIDFCGQDQRGEAAGLKFNLAVLAPLTSLQVVNLRLLETTSGELADLRKEKEQAEVVGPDFIYYLRIYPSSITHHTKYHEHDTENNV